MSEKTIMRGFTVVIVGSLCVDGELDHGRSWYFVRFGGAQ
jgi:hypothetical protein